MREENKDILDYVCIGNRIRKRRQDLGLTIKQVSDFSNIDEASISNIERATKRIGLTTLVQLTQVLNVSIDYIIFGYDNYSKKDIFDIIPVKDARDLQTIYKIIDVLVNRFKKGELE